MLAGQAAALGRELPAGALIEIFFSEAQDLVRGTRAQKRVVVPKAPLL